MSNDLSNPAANPAVNSLAVEHEEIPKWMIARLNEGWPLEISGWLKFHGGGHRAKLRSAGEACNFLLNQGLRFLDHFGKTGEAFVSEPYGDAGDFILEASEFAKRLRVPYAIRSEHYHRPEDRDLVRIEFFAPSRGGAAMSQLRPYSAIERERIAAPAYVKFLDLQAGVRVYPHKTFIHHSHTSGKGLRVLPGEYLVVVRTDDWCQDITLRLPGTNLPRNPGRRAHGAALDTYGAAWKALWDGAQAIQVQMWRLLECDFRLAPPDRIARSATLARLEALAGKAGAK